MLTVLMLTLILTVIGLAAITSTSLDIKMAGGERLRESTVNAAEACMSSGVQIKIGRASCRERGEISVVAVSLKKKRMGGGAAPGQNTTQAEIVGQACGNQGSAD